MLKRILILLLIAGAAALAYLRLHSGGELGDPNRLTLYGNIDIRQVNLAFEVGGRIAAMEATEGARVRAGDTLARLDDTRLRLALAAAEAQLAAQQAMVAQLEAGTRKEEVAKIRAELAAAQAEADNAVTSEGRIADLIEKRLASPQQADDVRAAARAARAHVDALKAGLDLALAGPRVEERQAARAQFDALRAQRDGATRDLADAVLRAPATGVVQNRILEPGDMASSGRAVYTLALDDPRWARVYLTEADLGRVQPGAVAELRTDSFPDRAYRGWVGYTSPSAEFTPKSVETTEVRSGLVYQARVFVCAPDGELRLGMPVTVTLLLDAPPATGCPNPDDKGRNPRQPD